eukprot:9773261-Lingulodinium_polyedra.AAC.1
MDRARQAGAAPAAQPAAPGGNPPPAAAQQGAAPARPPAPGGPPATGPTGAIVPASTTSRQIKFSLVVNQASDEVRPVLDQTAIHE